MGVPAFFRWLSRKYPSVIVDCTENREVDPETGQPIQGDITLPNPNGLEFDNLYLDMNGIIHPCTHPEDKPPPKNEDEMMIAIFECIDRLFAIVRPRKILYMAIDGVAPRAKMNQQRSRRFRSAKEAVEKRLEIERIRDELLSKGCILPPKKPTSEHFDSNCITPGTPFMDRLSKCLHYFIHDRINNCPAWKKIKVILSDANVPGEGEHKIMDFIRKQRSQPDHDPNTQHVLCGADADLIMLGLATHEPNFTIIREEFLPNKPRPCDICNEFGHEMDKCIGLNSLDSSSSTKPDIPISAEVRFIFVRLSVLREYLKKTLEMPNLPFKYDFERAVDDWVFMCFFVGNDFLPHLPSLEIREGAIDRLVELYKKCVYKTGGYLTESGEFNLERVQLILTDLGYAEDQIFKERQRREKQFKAREKSKRLRESGPKLSVLEKSTMLNPTPLGSSGPLPNPILNYKQEAIIARNANKRTASDANLDNGDDDEEDDNDEVRLWEDGFKNRYYESKFDVGPNNLGFRYSVALQYVRGLAWVLKYYYQGCASWNWYFPYHYAPFASDFVNICGLSTTFPTDSKPFNPLEQLMGVFPAASSTHVPSPWAILMSDPDSPIIDFYPEDFKIDLNGKKFAWQGVALLPFVDERRLFKALKPYYDKLSSEEVRRNKQGDSRLYVGRSNSNFKLLDLQYTSGISNIKQVPILMEGMRGTICVADENVPQNGNLKSPILGQQDIAKNEVVTVQYRDPVYEDNFIFPAIRLAKAVDPPKVLAPEVRDDKYKPVIGFNRNLPQAYLGQSGHRFVNRNIGGRQQVQGNAEYQNQSSGSNTYKSGNRPMHGQGGYQNHNNYGNNYGRGNYQYPQNNHGGGGGQNNRYDNSRNNSYQNYQRGNYRQNNNNNNNKNYY